MRKLLLFSCLLLLGLCLPQRSVASTTSQQLVDEGRSLFFNNGAARYDLLLQANEKFKAAVAADQTDQEANLFYAASRIGAFFLAKGDGTGLDTFRDLVEAFGLTRNELTSAEEFPYDSPPELYGRYNPPQTVPAGEELRLFLEASFVDLVDAVLVNLGRISASFSLTISATETGGAFPTEIDYSDVLLMKSFLHFLKAVISLATAYDMNFDLRELIVLVNADAFQLQRDFFDKYAQALSLRTSDGAAILATAKTELVAGINDFKSAYTSVTAETDDQADDLFSFESTVEMYEMKAAGNYLTELKNSLSANRAVSFSQETWQLTRDGSADSMELEVEKTGSGDFADGWLSMPFACGFDFCDGEVLDYRVSGSALTILAVSDGLCPPTVTLTGTISGGTISGGTYTVKDCNGTTTASGSFSGSRTSLATGAVADLNYLFGNTGKSRLDIRNNLPEFTAEGDILAGTFAAPVLNRILPGISTEKELIKAMEVEAVYSIPQRTLTVNGEAGDWSGISAVLNDETGENTTGGDQHVDLQALSVARDDSYLYWMTTLNDPPTGENVGYTLAIAAEDGPWLLYGLAYKEAAQEYSYVWLYDGDPDPDTISENAGDAKLGTVAEGRIPLNLFEGMSRVTITSANYSDYYSDETYQAILQLPHVAALAGAVSVASHNGTGKIFVEALDGPDINTARRLGETHLDAPGAFSIPGLPFGVDVYLFAWWDKDDNGIRGFGDFVGQSAGAALIQEGGASLDVSVATEIDDSFVMTKPGVYRVFGSNSFIMPTDYAGPWDPDEIAWDKSQWTFIGEGSAEEIFNTAGYYETILVIWDGDTMFHFDSFEDLSADKAFGLESYSWISSNLSNFDNGSGGSEPSYFKGHPDGMYARTTDSGFSLFTMPPDALGDDVDRQIKVTALSGYEDDVDLDGLLNSAEDANDNGMLDPDETDPFNSDTDGDGIRDDFEKRYSSYLDPRSDDAGQDGDGDGLTNLDEYYLDYNPGVAEPIGVFYGTVGLAFESEFRSHMGRVAMDADNHALVLSGLQSVNGIGQSLTPAAASGTYWFNSDGSGKVVAAGDGAVWQVAVNAANDVFVSAANNSAGFQDITLGVEIGQNCATGLKVNGSYAFVAMTNGNGWTSSSIGDITFASADNSYSASATYSNSAEAGGNHPHAESGAYTISDECAFTLTNSAGTWRGYVNDSGDTIVAANVADDPPYGQSILVATRSAASGFSNESLAGTYYMASFLAEKAGFSWITFNGSGLFIADTTFYDSGAGKTVTVTRDGSYAVAADGRITFTMDGEESIGALSLDGQTFIAARVDTAAVQQVMAAVKAIPAVDDDTDGDGTPDGADGCPYDPHKVVGGIAGCGQFDKDLTDADAGVPIVPAPLVSLAFSAVTAGGAITAVQTSNPTPPPEFTVVSDQTYEIDFLGAFSGLVEICIDYKESDVRDEGSLKLFHSTDSGQSWQDITTEIDTLKNKVCGETASFSVFMLGELAEISTSFALVKNEGKTSVNAIGYIVSSPELTKASGLYGAVQYIDGLSKWDAALQKYVSYVPGVTVTDFDLAIGDAYFISVSASSSLTLTGAPASISYSFAKNADKTSVTAMGLRQGAYESGLTDAAALYLDIPGIDGLSRWDTVTQQYVSYVPGVVSTNFSLADGEAYFISVSEDSAW